MGVLSAIVWTPLLGALLLMLIPAGRVAWIQRLALLATAIPLVLALNLYQLFREAPRPGFQWVEDLVWSQPLSIHYKLGVDGLSLPMLLLSGLVCLTATWISREISFRHKEYYALMLTAMTGVMGVFATTDLFFLILFYEMASIPMFFLVGIWGSDKTGEGKPIHRQQAAMKLLIYLQLGGGLVLIGILALYFLAQQSTGSFSFDLEVLRHAPLGLAAQRVLFLLFFVGFGIEAGLVPFHTWLPEGHSSAPTALSMLLAGVLLKMGGYGILRVGVDLCPEGATFWMPFFAGVAVLNVLYGGLCALRQTDIKVMIAYSSVSHMGMVFLGISDLTAPPTSAAGLFGLNGAVFQMFSHGVITALLFGLAGTVYHITHSRSLRSWGGLAARMPFLATLFGLAAMGSLGLPGMTGFVAELMVFLGTWQVSPVLAGLAICGLVITTTYLMRALGFGFFGPLNPRLANVRDAELEERLPLTLLALTTLIFGFFPALLTQVSNPALVELLARVQR